MALYCSNFSRVLFVSVTNSMLKYCTVNSHYHTLAIVIKIVLHLVFLPPPLLQWNPYQMIPPSGWNVRGDGTEDYSGGRYTGCWLRETLHCSQGSYTTATVKLVSGVLSVYQLFDHKVLIVRNLVECSQELCSKYLRYMSTTRNQASIWTSTAYQIFSVGGRSYILGRAVVECVP